MDTAKPRPRSGAPGAPPQTPGAAEARGGTSSSGGRRRARREPSRALAQAVCVALALVGVLPFAATLVVRSSWARAWAAQKGQELIREQGIVARVDPSLRVWPLAVELAHVRVESSDGGPPALECERLRVRPKIFALLAGKFAVDQVELDQPRIRLVLRGGKVANLELPGAPWPEQGSPPRPAPDLGADRCVPGSRHRRHSRTGQSRRPGRHRRGRSRRGRLVRDRVSCRQSRSSPAAAEAGRVPLRRRRRALLDRGSNPRRARDSPRPALRGRRVCRPRRGPGDDARVQPARRRQAAGGALARSHAPLPPERGRPVHSGVRRPREGPRAPCAGGARRRPARDRRLDRRRRRRALRRRHDSAGSERGRRSPRRAARAVLVRARLLQPGEYPP